MISMNINILFPVLNEHLRLEKGIDKCVAYMRENVHIPYKLTIVDNGSDDDTPEIGKRLADKYDEVEHVRIEERGVGIAFKTGVLRCEADIVGYMDIDLSTDLEYLSKTIEIFEKKTCVCVLQAGESMLLKYLKLQKIPEYVLLLNNARMR